MVGSCNQQHSLFHAIVHKFTIDTFGVTAKQKIGRNILEQMQQLLEVEATLSEAPCRAYAMHAKHRLITLYP